MHALLPLQCPATCTVSGATDTSEGLCKAQLGRNECDTQRSDQLEELYGHIVQVLVPALNESGANIMPALRLAMEEVDGREPEEVQDDPVRVATLPSLLCRCASDLLEWGHDLRRTDKAPKETPLRCSPNFNETRVFVTCLAELLDDVAKTREAGESEPVSARAPLEDGSGPVGGEAHPTCRRKPRMKRGVAEPLIADHLKRKPHDSAKEVATATRCSVGVIGESRAWKLNQARLKIAKKEGTDPKAIPLNEKLVDESGASKLTQGRRAAEELDARIDEIDTRDRELHQRIGERKKAYPEDTPEQIAAAVGCTAGEVERRQAELDRLATEQAESAREETVEEHPATKLPYQKWIEKPV